jgi:hypothetical protein
LTEPGDERGFRVRASAGKPIDAGETLRSPAPTPTLPPDAVDNLIDLRNLLDQQADGGRQYCHV